MQRPSETELKLALIFILLLLIFILAMSIALGHVEEKTSYGLADAIKLFSYLAASAAGWAFGRYEKGE